MSYVIVQDSIWDDRNKYDGKITGIEKEEILRPGEEYQEGLHVLKDGWKNFIQILCPFVNRNTCFFAFEFFIYFGY